MNKLFCAVMTSVVLLFVGCGTDGNKFTSPSGIAVTARSSSILISWQTVDSSLGYNVYRSDVSGALSTKQCIAFGLTASSYLDSSATPGVTYYYQVTAYNSAGNSSPSAELSTYIKGPSATGDPLKMSFNVFTLAGTGKSGKVDGTGTGASFGFPVGITAYGPNLYVADTYNNIIRKIVISTGVVTTIAGSAASGTQDGTGAAARFYNPFGIATDGTNLYVSDTSNNTIRSIVISTGVVTTLAGAPTSGSSNGTGAVASFKAPRGITINGNYLYVADSGNHMIRKIDISANKLINGVVTTFAGSITAGSADDNGIAASFGAPEGIATDGTSLYVTDSTNNTIRKITLAGAVTTIAGSGTAGATDAEGTSASFNTPTGIVTDGSSLFIADSKNNVIRSIDITIPGRAPVSTVAGSGSAGSASGFGTAASFSQPMGITTDGTNIFVSDYANCLIREIL